MLVYIMTLLRLIGLLGFANFTKAQHTLPGLTFFAATHGARHMGLYDPAKLQREVHDAVTAMTALNGKRNLENAEALALDAPSSPAEAWLGFF